MHRKIQRMNTNERAYSMFENMLDEINSETIRILFNLTIASKEELEKLEQANIKKTEEDIELKEKKIFKLVFLKAVILKNLNL